MSWIRGTANAILVATLIRPVARRLISRARRRAREHPAAPLAIPAEELLEAALLAELGASAPDADVPPPETLDEVDGRSVVRMLVLVGVVAIAASSAAFAVATVIRRRRARAAARAKEPREVVAITVEEGAAEAAEAVIS